MFRGKQNTTYKLSFPGGKVIYLFSWIILNREIKGDAKCTVYIPIGGVF